VRSVVERRRLPGTDRFVSAIGFPVTGDSRFEEISRGLLRRALDRGLTLYDASEARNAAAAERAIREAVDPAGRPEISVATRLANSASGLVEPRSVVRAARESADRLGRRPLDIAVVALPEPDSAAYLDWVRVLSTLRSEGIVRSWCAEPRSSADAAATAARAGQDGAGTVSLRYNLLEREPVESLATTDTSMPRVLVRDPHAGGALNGRLLRSPHAGSARALRPVHWLSLQDRLAPVARLGFLTEGRRRTLGQAALQYCLASPAVTAVFPAFDSPDAVDEYTDIDRVPALSDSEIARVRRLRPRGLTSVPIGPGAPHAPDSLG
jgi:aryl-alcohol dehydrogenase-like predicted oxidoreductase